MSTAVWKETSSRGLAKGAMNQYSTVAEALFEIIDNPIDYRFGRKLSIDISVQKSDDLVVVEDTGGEGMDDGGIQDWLNWGSGHPHLPSDIGRYHYGGKAATGFLANHIRILARRAGTTPVWIFEDEEWATREDWADYGAPKTIDAGQLPEHLARLAPDLGFVRFELRDLKRGHRYRLEDLKFRLSNSYRSLLRSGDITITMDGSPVLPLKLPESAAFPPVPINRRLPGGKLLRGKIWRLNRDDVMNSRLVKGGIRALFNGRVITEGEYFGYYGEGKGLLASLIGELELDFCTPVPSKNAWVTDSEEWYEVEEAMAEVLKPIIKVFRDAAEKNQVSREEKKRANNVHRQLLDALKMLAGLDPDGGTGANGDRTLVPEEAGRKSPEPTGEQSSDSGNGSRSTPKNLTPPPARAVGRLRRLVNRLDQSGGLPPIRPGPLDVAFRSGRDVENRSEVIIINNRHPMYLDLDGCDAYLAETAILEALRPDDDGDPMKAEDYYGQALQLLNAWYKVIRE